MVPENIAPASLFDATLSSFLRHSDASDESAAGMLQSFMTHGAREANMRRAWEVYQAALERAALIERFNRHHEPEDTKEARLAEFLSDEASICITAIQPARPSKVLLAASELRSKIAKFRITGRQAFPSLDDETIPAGLLFSEMRPWSLRRDCHQVYVNGLIYDIHDCSFPRDGQRYLYLASIIERIVLVFKTASNFFHMVSYEGDLVASVRLKGLSTSLIPLFIDPNASPILSDPFPSLLTSYRWDVTLAPQLWGSEHELQECYIKLILDICWGLGINRTDRKQVESVLRQLGYMH